MDFFEKYGDYLLQPLNSAAKCFITVSLYEPSSEEDMKVLRNVINLLSQLNNKA